ncbi:copper chaperone PCu(A)C [Kribbella sp. NBC_01245]|uniref:copper chaperone PCu(A)C n=1 Tax=Kribbella sp. NBC_01245 TaxID=2903578 RepID=UPI002E2ACCF6|nr:copper chaperone PCu(A)C [Kribbella sp. NBC_01245]
MTMIRTGRKAIRYLPTLLAVGLLAGCSAQPPVLDLPAGGVDADSGSVVIDDIWLDGPHGVAAGADAPLRLALENMSASDDALVGVTTPIAKSVQLEQGGRPTGKIVLPAGRLVDFEWQTGVELEGLRTSIQPGQPFTVTLRFAHAAPVAVQVTAGPLAAPDPAPSKKERA